MTPYEAAVNMFHREHARWSQWVLFFFGSIVSIFVIGEKASSYVPIWALALFGCVVSIMWVMVATTLRASTKAWRETIFALEDANEQQSNEVKVFHLQKEKWEGIRQWEDLKTTLHFWKKETITSVTRVLTLFGIISAISFFTLLMLTFFSCDLKNETARDQFTQRIIEESRFNHAILKGVTMTKFNDALRGYAYNVLKRDGFRCRYCGLDGTKSFDNWLALSWDHLLPKNHPKRNDEAYIVAACNFCNGADNRYLEKAIADGFDFNRCAPDELVERRRLAVRKTRSSYREFWETNVRRGGATDSSD